MQMNPAAAHLLRRNIKAGSSLSENFPVLFGPYAVWKQSGNTMRDILQLGEGMQAKLRFVAIDSDDAHGVVIFLEDMQRVQAEAQQIKLAALGRLTANIAHEVRNPLSAISYAAELMLEELADVKSQRMLHIVLDNSQRINRIVQDVMQINRRDRAQPEVFELDIMLLAFIDEFEKAERTETGVLSRVGLAEAKVVFDRGHLRQVLWNLCRNALRHGSRSVGSVKLELSRDAGRNVLDVLDDGPGVSADQRNKLFEPFFTTASDGTGLGLYIAKELCEANGAQLQYRSGMSQVGACFRITFANPQ
jgi:two-component system sensor histidine kinase PilS (NtrC family)